MPLSAAEPERREMARIEASLTICVLVCLGGCAAGDPHAEIEALIERTEAAAEARDTGFFRDLVSDDYVDVRGRTRDDVIDLVRGYFLLSARVEVVIRIERIALAGTDAADVELQAALVGRAEGRSLLGVDGNLYDLDIELVKEGSSWRVIGADWTTAF
jgi:hypothetical protein